MGNSDLNKIPPKCDEVWLRTDHIEILWLTLCYLLLTYNINVLFLLQIWNFRFSCYFNFGYVDFRTLIKWIKTCYTVTIRISSYRFILYSHTYLLRAMISWDTIYLHEWKYVGSTWIQPNQFYADKGEINTFYIKKMSL